MKLKLSARVLKALLTLSVLFCSTISPALITSTYAAQKRNSTRRPRRVKPTTSSQPAPQEKPAVVREDPIAAQARYEAGSFLETTGNHEGAQSAYREAVKLQPKNALYHHALGSVLQRMAAPKPSTAYLPWTNQLGPNQTYDDSLRRQSDERLRAGAYDDMMRCRERQADLQRQQQAIDRATEDFRNKGGRVPPQAPRPLVMGDPCPPIGLSESRSILPPQSALPDLINPVVPAPVDPAINHPFGFEEFGGPFLNKLPVSSDEAVTELGMAAQLEPGNAAYHWDYASILYHVGKHYQAEVEYRNAVQLAPLNAGYHYSLGVVLEAEHKWAEAAIAYNDALQLDPKNKNYKAQYKYAKKMAKAK